MDTRTPKTSTAGQAMEQTSRELQGLQISEPTTPVSVEGFIPLGMATITVKLYNETATPRQIHRFLLRTDLPLRRGTDGIARWLPPPGAPEVTALYNKLIEKLRDIVHAPDVRALASRLFWRGKSVHLLLNSAFSII